MASKVGVWSVQAGRARRVERSRVQLEIDLESWIEDNPALIAEGLTVVGRQLHVDGGFIDLLCIDVQGRWIVVELKRDRLYREAVAQALDYAASIKSLAELELFGLVRSNLDRLGDRAPSKESLDTLFENQSGIRDVAIVVAGAGADAGLERVVTFLAEFDVPVRVVTFEVFELADGQQLLIREVIEDDERTTTRTSTSKYRTVEEIGALGGSPEVIGAYNRIIEAAEHLGLAIRPYVGTVMIAPPHQRNRYLMALSPDSRRGLQISHGPEAFEEFFPGVIASDVEDLLGPGDGRYYIGDELQDRARLIEQFFSELPDPDDPEQGRRADAATILPLAALVEPGEWTTYGELSVAAIGRSSAAMTIGNIARSNPDFPNPHRILNARGVPPTNWRSDDGGGPDVCRQRLEAEGIRFVPSGSADPTQRIEADELTRRSEAAAP